VRFRFVARERDGFPVAALCAALEVSRSGFYAWRGRPESRRQGERRALRPEVRRLFIESRRTYGAPRIARALRHAGQVCGRHRIARLMRAEGLRARGRRARRPRTTDARHGFPIAPNVLDRSFRVDAPDRVWVADITYLPTHEGWLFLAVLLDLFSRRVVGFAMGPRITGALAAQALRMALARRSPAPGLLHHSDRGCQYAALDYQLLLRDHGLVSSMSRTGNCLDNAVAESFFSTLKIELVHRCDWTSRSEAHDAVFAYIEGFYNRHRLHSALGYRSPVEYEEIMRAA